MLNKFREVKIQLHISVKLNLSLNQEISDFESVIDPK